MCLTIYYIHSIHGQEILSHDTSPCYSKYSPFHSRPLVCFICLDHMTTWFPILSFVSFLCVFLDCVPLHVLCSPCPPPLCSPPRSPRLHRPLRLPTTLPHEPMRRPSRACPRILRKHRHLSLHPIQTASPVLPPLPIRSNFPVLAYKNNASGGYPL